MRLLTCIVLILVLFPSVTAADLRLAGELRAVSLRAPRRPRDPAVRYVSITDRRLQGAFMRIAQARTRLGTNARVVTLQAIESGYPGGVDLAERVRLFLRDAHANWGTRYVLVGGDASVV